MSYQRLLITRTDRLGDLVLSTPVFQALREKFPESHLACLTFLENRAAVEGNPHLNEVILYDKKGSEKGWLGNYWFAKQLAKKKFDAVIHLHPTHRMHWAGWLARIPVRIGYRKKSGWTLTHSIADQKGEGLKHESEYNFDLLQFLQVGFDKKFAPFFPLREKDKRSLSFLLRNLNRDDSKPYVVINPGASCPSKIWPADRFAELINRLQEKYGLQAVLIGSENDLKFSRNVRRYSSQPILDLNGRLSLGMLGWLLKDSKLLISNDSGPVHVAGAVGTPVISIFGRKLPGLSPRRWGPLGNTGRVIHKDVECEICLAHNCQINFLCLDAVSVEDVLKKAAEFLA